MGEVDVTSFRRTLGWLKRVGTECLLDLAVVSDGPLGG